MDQGGRAWLASLLLRPIRREAIEDCLALIDVVDPIVARLEREIKGLAKPDPRVDALTTIPGIGLITAMTLVAEIGNVSRFPTARKLWRCCFASPPIATSPPEHAGRTPRKSGAVEL